MTGTMVIYLACGPGHPVSVALRVVEVVGVLLPIAGLVSLITGLWQRSAAAKQPSRPFQGYPARRPLRRTIPDLPLRVIRSSGQAVTCRVGHRGRSPRERRSSWSAWRCLSLGCCASCSCGYWRVS
jgi:hypothetical protein